MASWAVTDLNPEFPAKRTVNQYLCNADEKVKALQLETERLESVDLDDMKAIERLNEIYEEPDALRANAAEARARKILKGLGFSKDIQDMEATSLFGGWRKRLSLARPLFILPDLLLLDAVIWLQENKALTIYKGTYVDFSSNVYEQRRKNYLKRKGKNLQKGSRTLLNRRLQDVSFAYRDKKLLSRINFEVTIDTRVVLLGPNGVGKTTFLKLLSGELQPSRGLWTQEVEVKIGVLAQYSNLPADLTPMVYLLALHREPKVKLVLTKVDLENSVWTKDIKLLSGGQMTKVALAEIILTKPDVLILDELTNSLDFESINELTEALSKLPGAAVLVSHDQRCVEGVGYEVWHVTDGKVRRIEGGFQAYVAGVVARAKILTSSVPHPVSFLHTFKNNN
ncbi:ABCF1 [Cordylochernes scorpioides]|uniref:ABCF1 n=1 Tax=Cordylochernes scorpioides TaxID=51811 RepID=A0ABY6L918_9ARAC|nr:ABCF1 [Cordylochernes scorpioides]